MRENWPFVMVLLLLAVCWGAFYEYALDDEPQPSAKHLSEPATK